MKDAARELFAPKVAQKNISLFFDPHSLACYSHPRKFVQLPYLFTLILSNYDLKKNFWNIPDSPRNLIHKSTGMAKSPVQSKVNQTRRQGSNSPGSHTESLGIPATGPVKYIIDICFVIMIALLVYAYVFSRLSIQLKMGDGQITGTAGQIISQVTSLLIGYLTVQAGPRVSQEVQNIINLCIRVVKPHMD
jgi:hypothetical protein